MQSLIVNSRYISCPGSRTNTRSPAGSAGWSPRPATCELLGGCSCFHTPLLNSDNDTLIPHRHLRSQIFRASSACYGLQPDHLHRVQLGWMAGESRSASRLVPHGEEQFCSVGFGNDADTRASVSLHTLTDAQLWVRTSLKAEEKLTMMLMLPINMAARRSKPPPGSAGGDGRPLLSTEEWTKPWLYCMTSTSQHSDRAPLFNAPFYSRLFFNVNKKCLVYKWFGMLLHQGRCLLLHLLNEN